MTLSPGCVPGLSICSRAQNPLLISTGVGAGMSAEVWELFEEVDEGRRFGCRWSGWAGQGVRLGVPRWSEYGSGQQLKCVWLGFCEPQDWALCISGEHLGGT